MTSVQNQTAAVLLTEFDRPLAVLFISKNEDWQFRQKLQYESMKGLMKSDFLGLADFKSEMGTLMGAGSVGQKLAWKVMTASKVVDTQPKLMTQLVPHPELGLVGRFVATLAGFTKLFVTPLEILRDKAGFGARVSGL